MFVCFACFFHFSLNFVHGLCLRSWCKLWPNCISLGAAILTLTTEKRWKWKKWERWQRNGDWTTTCWTAAEERTVARKDNSSSSSSHGCCKSKYIRHTLFTMAQKNRVIEKWQITQSMQNTGCAMDALWNRWIFMKLGNRNRKSLGRKNWPDILERKMRKAQKFSFRQEIECWRDVRVCEIKAGVRVDGEEDFTIGVMRHKNEYHEINSLSVNGRLCRYSCTVHRCSQYFELFSHP